MRFGDEAIGGAGNEEVVEQEATQLSIVSEILSGKGIGEGRRRLAKCAPGIFPGLQSAMQ